MKDLNLVLENGDGLTVFSEYTPVKKTAKEYQSEAELEKNFIADLVSQGYEYLKIHRERDLIANLRQQLEILNNYKFSENEWAQFFAEKIAGKNDGIVEKTNKIQRDHIQILQRDNGETKNIYLLDKKDIHNNRLQVINQFEISRNEGALHDNRYDVTILVNGLPLIHVELKRRGVDLREAFYQINRYGRESFGAASGLYEYAQIFVISNGTRTKYYSNTTRENHIKEKNQNLRNKSKKTSNSFEFTSFWADANNRVITDLVDFTKTFFQKNVVLNLLTKYCVFDSENKLLVMRPYQIAATERILNKIKIATNYKKYGTIEGGGYIWHTTGSGKTLTSFKTAQLASESPEISKVLFVVDRKDLDYQTIREYDRFQKGAANGNNSTRILKRQLENIGEHGERRNYKIIVTTIQKLTTFLRKNPKHAVYNEHVVLIFDECHRSQFGDMHTEIIRKFKKYHLFGFTGTPIFAANSGGKNPHLKTTAQAFGEKLHVYTIVDAINDKNVLPFRIDYLEMMHGAENIEDKNVQAIDRERALMDPRRISAVTKYILDNFDRKTMRNYSYKLKDQRVNGFNSILATASIPMAMSYYREFRRQLSSRNWNLKIATIFSFSVNEEDSSDGIVSDENLDTDLLDQTSRDFLEQAISDYNQHFHTNFDTSAEKFQNYYKDLSLRVKNREVDLLIVVNMFLTGFDATTLNTLWVDKDLKMHGLTQAFSRTNRILNSVKTYGNIVCFRNLQKKVDDAVALFGDKQASGIVLLKSYREYFDGYDEEEKHHFGYRELITELRENFPLSQEISGDENKKRFVKLFSMILRLRNILRSFDDFEREDILPLRELQNYQGIYLDIYNDVRPKFPNCEKEIINDDLVFEIELTRQTEVNVDYILDLVLKYFESNGTDKEILVSLDKAMSASLELRSKKQLIYDFINEVTNISEIHDDWQKFVREKREKELEEIIVSEKLRSKAARELIKDSFHNGFLKTSGTDFDAILPAMDLFGEDRPKKKAGVIEKLRKFFEKYFGAA